MSVTPIRAQEPVLHVLRLFRVRVARKGMPSYSYTARARHSFDAWEAAMDRAIEVCNTAPVSIVVEPKAKSTPLATYSL